ncbi:MAG: ribosome maturation factor RimP [Humidesulfovibrio sp.]|jgi:ribosome maturation factor RimP|uniref:ribosome maturation factor RimP n=1 Tax=Humidesulfovibrio sp. TaxID=2910988 RepID=UPI0027338B18|nr:ribosome maturation factor RimP [Humidesulfovibrio sp.]MDP2847341.1 ribosome maturation factor RimP [Humidesulfovibrio sp.]
MTRSPLIERLAGHITPALEPLGVQLWGVEFASAGSRMVVRIYIDAEDGVSIAACAKASRSLGAVFDAEDLLPGAYVLEVSSPGLERRFFSAAQMAAYLDRVVDARLHEPQDNRRHLRGKLAAVEGDDILIDEAGQVTRVAFDRLKSAHLVHEFPDTGIKGS